MSNGPDQPINPSEISHSEIVKQVSLIKDFNALFTDLNKFNSEFSLGGMMGKAITSSINKEFDPENEVSEDLSTLGKNAQELTASGISMVHQGTLSKLGLELEPVSEQNLTISSSIGNLKPGELRVNVADNIKFLSFLSSINTSEDNDQDLSRNLGSLANIFEKQIIDNYDLQNPSDEALKLLGSLGKIVDEYERLGIKGGAKLKTILMHSRKRDLMEYITIEKAGLLNEPGKNFGPSDWQKDATPEFLRKNWDKALQILRKTGENPNAKDLYNTLFEHLNKCLKIASEDLEKLDYLSEEKKREFREILAETKEALG